MELGDHDTYPMIGMGSISLCTSLSDVLELDDVLHVPSLTKDLLSLPAMT